MYQARDVHKGVFETLLHARNQIDSAIDLFGWHTKPETSTLDNDNLLPCAERMIREREYRKQHFPTMPFGEPVWDLLLDLFVWHVRCRQISITSACIATKVPPTTALRYIAMLEAAGDLKRVASSVDARRYYISLSEPVLAAMRNYLSQAILSEQVILRETAR
jgi:hypothetical protein